MWILCGLGIWLLGILIFYLLDAWIDYDLVYDADKYDPSGFNIIDKKGDPIIALWILFSITWPMWVGFVVPGVLAKKLHDYIKNKKIQIDKQKENKLKIRIAQEKEVEQELAQIDKELNLKHKTV